MGVISGSQILLECLKENSIDTVFGYPGGAVIPLFDALYDESEYFNIIRTAHEQEAVHAADAYARTTGKVGVSIVTSGPGATNTVTGIATAYMDSIPIVVLTGQVPTALLGKDSFQEIDITGVTLPITKHNILVKKVEDLAPAINKAFQIAQEGRPGPVLVDIPKDIFLNKIDYCANDNNNIFSGNKVLDNEKAKELAVLINNSNKPVIYAGGGVKMSDASDILTKLAEKGNIPVVNTLMGLGSIDRENRLSLGLVGMHGFKEANLAVTNSDLVIAIGARFSDRVTGKKERFAPGAKIIHIDIDETEIDKNMPSYLSFVCDVKHSLEKIVELIDIKDRLGWINEIESWKVDDKIKDNDFVAKNILKSLNTKFNDETVIVTDVGQHQMWTAQYWGFNEKTSFVTSGGLGTMGFGLGAAIGGKVANPDKDVILVVGDGGFRMCSGELATIASYKLPILILLLNNNTLGMVRQWQKMFNNKRYMETDIGDEVDYMKLVDAYGIEGHRVDNIESLNKVIDNIDKLDKPLLIECKIDKDDCVLPIVPPGEAIDELIVDFY